MATKYPSALFFTDLETTGLDENRDHILEVAFIVTDFDLKPHFGYEGVVGMNDGIKESLGRNPIVVDMHLKSGLLRASRDSTDTLASIEQDIIGMLKTKSTQDKGEYMIAGSGVAAFDLQWYKKQMPELASWFAYYPFDVGVLRRSARILSGGKDLVVPVKESFAEGEKKHRALSDTQAHLKEAMAFRDFFQDAAARQEA